MALSHRNSLVLVTYYCVARFYTQTIQTLTISVFFRCRQRTICIRINIGAFKNADAWAPNKLTKSCFLTPRHRQLYFIQLPGNMLMRDILDCPRAAGRCFICCHLGSEVFRVSCASYTWSCARWPAGPNLRKILKSNLRWRGISVDLQ